jgi:hypothetical protein
LLLTSKGEAGISVSNNMGKPEVSVVIGEGLDTVKDGIEMLVTGRCNKCGWLDAMGILVEIPEYVISAFGRRNSVPGSTP